MKKYIKPEIIDEVIELEDIVMASTQDESDIDPSKGINIGDLFN